MMKSLKYILLMSGLITTPALYAACPVSLPHDQLLDCIVRENATNTQQPKIIESQTVSKQGELQLNTPSNNLANIQTKI